MAEWKPYLWVSMGSIAEWLPWIRMHTFERSQNFCRPKIQYRQSGNKIYLQESCLNCQPPPKKNSNKAESKTKPTQFSQYSLDGSWSSKMTRFSLQIQQFRGSRHQLLEKSNIAHHCLYCVWNTKLKIQHSKCSDIFKCITFCFFFLWSISYY